MSSIKAVGNLIVGIDPGPVPGVVMLLVGNGKVTGVEVAQVSAGLIDTLVAGIVQPWSQLGVPVTIAVERFVVSRRSGRSSAAGAGAITRDMVGVVELLGRELGATVVQRNASQVKAWATDERLTRAGIEIPSGMRHAKDGARHALFAACHAGYLPDPLSKRST